MKHIAKMKQSGETFHNRPGEINVIFSDPAKNGMRVGFDVDSTNMLNQTHCHYH